MPMRSKAKIGCFVYSFLKNRGRLQAAAKTFMHQPVIEGRSFPPRKPYEGSIYQVTKADVLYSGEGVPFRHSQLDMLHRDREMVQFCISLRHVEYKPGIQPSRPEGCDLLQAGRRRE